MGLRFGIFDDDDGVSLFVSEAEFAIIEADEDAVVGRGGTGEGEIGEDAHVEDSLTRGAFCADLGDDDGATVWNLVERRVGDSFVERAAFARASFLSARIGSFFGSERARFEESDESVHAFVGEGVFEAASFFASFVGGHAEDIVEELEKQDVTGVDAAGGDFSYFGELNRFALDVGEVAHIGESFESKRDRRRLDGACGGDIANAGFV